MAEVLRRRAEAASPHLRQPPRRGPRAARRPPGRGHPGRAPAAVPVGDDRRVPGHRPGPVGHLPHGVPRGPEPGHRGRRRRPEAVDLPVPLGRALAYLAARARAGPRSPAWAPTGAPTRRCSARSSASSAASRSVIPRSRSSRSGPSDLRDRRRGPRRPRRPAPRRSSSGPSIRASKTAGGQRRGPARLRRRGRAPARRGHPHRRPEGRGRPPAGRRLRHRRAGALQRGCHRSSSALLSASGVPAASIVERLRARQRGGDAVAGAAVGPRAAVIGPPGPGRGARAGSSARPPAELDALDDEGVDDGSAAWSSGCGRGRCASRPAASLRSWPKSAPAGCSSGCSPTPAASVTSPTSTTCSS